MAELNTIRDLNQRLFHLANGGRSNMNPIQNTTEAPVHRTMAEGNRPVSPCSERRILRLQEQVNLKSSNHLNYFKITFIYLSVGVVSRVKNITSQYMVKSTLPISRTVVQMSEIWKNENLDFRHQFRPFCMKCSKFLSEIWTFQNNTIFVCPKTGQVWDYGIYSNLITHKCSKAFYI